MGINKPKIPSGDHKTLASPWRITGMGEGTRNILKIGLADILKRFFALFASNSLRDWLLGLFFVYLARKDTEIFGYFMVAISAGAIVLKIVEFGFNDYLVRHVGRSPRQNAKAVASVNFIKIVLLMMCTIGLALFCRVMDYSTELSLFVIVVGFGMGMRSLSDSLFMIFRLIGRQVTESSIKFVAMAASLIWAVGLLELGMRSVWIGSLLVVNSLISIVFAVLALKSNLNDILHYSWVKAKEIVKGSYTFTLIACFAILANKTNIFFLQKQQGTAAVAEYMTSWIIIDAVSCAVSAHLLSGVIYPLLSRNQTLPLTETLYFLRKTLLWLMVLAWPICLFLYTQSDWIIRVLYGSGYAGAPALQKILVWTIPLAFCQNVCFSLALARGDSGRLAMIFGVGLGINLALNRILIPNFGSTGAAWVILGTKLVICGLIFSYCQRTLGMTRRREWTAIFGMAALLSLLFIIMRIMLPSLAAALLALSVYLIVLHAKRNRFSLKNEPFAEKLSIEYSV